MANQLLRFNTSGSGGALPLTDSDSSGDTSAGPAAVSTLGAPGFWSPGPVAPSYQFPGLKRSSQGLPCVFFSLF
uniref:Uncharacterized protein n=1 Tax=Kalanchoe fedtschenkoi TaxID=63787 RepID=A0A7N0RB28_KALFE